MTVFDEAIAHAQAHEVDWTRDPHAEPLRYGVHHDDPPPWNRLHGPVHPRGPVSGQVWVGGEVRQSWGEPERADQTFSVAKTYLALLAGVAHDRGLLPDPDEPVVQRLPGIGFDSPHNRMVTWSHLLGQTSEWEGSCFGIPDQVDRYRKLVLDPKPVQGQKGDARPLQVPGTYWEYNDVRINQLSLALLHLFGQALTQVFEQSLLHPIGGGHGFRWEGYEQSWVDLPARAGQAAGGLGARGRPLGRRCVHQQQRPGTHRPVGAQPRSMAHPRPIAISDLSGMVGAHAPTPAPGPVLRLAPLAQPQRRGLSGGERSQPVHVWRGWQLRLDRARPPSRGGGALDQPRPLSGVCQPHGARLGRLQRWALKASLVLR